MNNRRKSLRTTAAALSLALSLTAFAVPAAAASSYTIKDNDTFWSISRAHGILLNDVLKANAAINPLNLQVGQKITLPGVQTYNVQEGDTFWLLSKHFNISEHSLRAVNRNINPYNLYQGLEIFLPAGAKAADNAENTVKAESTAAASPIASYKKKLAITATAYSSAAFENGKWGAVDYFGNPLQLGTIAVDPNVIPMGSKVFITGYNNPALPKGGMVAYAKDQGSAIKGNRVDIFLPGSPETVSEFGIQNVTVYIIK
jgi:3D (Asp-Asp-Asp) domain-containing protein